MLIALLLVLGVDLLVVVALGAAVLGRRRWVKRQKGVSAGKIRVVAGDVDGLSAKWKGGFGHWIDGVLVWIRAPCCFATSLYPSIDSLDSARRPPTTANGWVMIPWSSSFFPAPPRSRS
jgi:hypothetical protein